METAIWFMLVISALCFLMTSVAMYGHYQTKLEAAELEHEITVDQIGEYYLASVKAGDPCGGDYNFNRNSGIMLEMDKKLGGVIDAGEYGGGKYHYALKDNVLMVWRAGDTNRNIVLYVDASLAANNELVVSAWRYSEPAAE